MLVLIGISSTKRLFANVLAISLLRVSFLYVLGIYSYICLQIRF
jgi:hypothetical protein